MIHNYENINFNPKGIYDPKVFQSPIAHFSELENLQFSTLNKYREKIIECKRKYIFCAHVEEYFNMTINLSEFRDKFFVLFSIPKNNKVLLSRIGNSTAWYQNQKEPDYKRIAPESYELVDSIDFGIPSDSIFQINSDIFYTTEGFDYLQDNLSEYFGITLPEVCRNLHSVYISTQTVAVETFDKNMAV